jgi:hypothetical protein
VIQSGNFVFVRFEVFGQDNINIAACRNIPVGYNPHNFRNGSMDALTDINALPGFEPVLSQKSGTVII